jgi:DNA-binding SARP family transcriptional activator
LNVVRTVIGDHLVSSRDGVRLDLAHVAVDVEDFLEKARAGLALHREGRTAEAVPLLEAAEALYGGGFLEEDQYDDWAASLRDEIRAEYIDVLRTLASGADGSRYWRRILAIDTYDEEAHLALVSTLATAGMHGEARRAYRRYVERMDEIGVEPAPFPTLSRP